MGLLRVPVDDDVICDADDAFTAFQNLIHAVLEHILAHGLAKWHAVVTVSTKWAVEGREKGTFLIKA